MKCKNFIVKRMKTIKCEHKLLENLKNWSMYNFKNWIRFDWKHWVHMKSHLAINVAIQKICFQFTCVTVDVTLWLLLGMQTTTNLGAELCKCGFCWTGMPWVIFTCWGCCCCCCCTCCCCPGLETIPEEVGVCARDCKITNFPVDAGPPLRPGFNIIVRLVCGCPGLGLETAIWSDQIHLVCIFRNRYLKKFIKRKV